MGGPQSPPGAEKGLKGGELMATQVLTGFVDGTWLPRGRRLVTRHNPGRSDRIAVSWSPARPAEARAAMDAAARALPVWSDIPPGARLTFLDSFLLKIEQQSLSLSATITRENGKTLREARAEIGAALADGRHLLSSPRTCARCLRGHGRQGSDRV